ncbi:Ig-like domain-containing protein [Lelliottia sp. V106_10]|uniref:BapA/Bap/LapF family large adhesin n=1 Tax=Lelliottia wanjuensis TaxID=3050585 RepID=UPI00254DAED9|nr:MULTISPECIES: BapA/Bap/LapF family large adhesin [unclassified Lelliottia]MDK9359064.1 Ig-like domain-containing protein [Lelliottia sp. V106_16]MDK9373360.1 Ig-like domain-containing protein [Lelliottia sp. V106_10]MDK9600153.1 Ig-like domain-containing protein [Lelliottia sp. V106_5]
MSQISVISKLTGVETTTEGTQVTLDHSSIVKLHVGRADISHYTRSGNDLIVSLHSGEVITLKNFYHGDAQGESQLVLQEGNGALWWIEDPTAAEHYEAIASTDVLMGSSGDGGGAAIWPWVLGGVAVAGGIALAAGGGGGGGGGGGDDDNPTNPGNPGNPTDPDTTPPNAPTNLQFSGDGTSVSGTAEPGSTITLKDANGNLVGTGKTGSDGKFTIELGTPLTNGEQISATATDSSGNVSKEGHVTAPDLVTPDAPDILIVNDDVGSETGPLSNGQRTDDARPTLSGIGEAGTTITIFDNGTKIGTTTVDAKGNWSFTPPNALSNGSHTLTSTATDAAGHTSAPSAGITIVVDTVAPTAPVISSVTDDVDPVTGPLNNGGSTNDQRPLLTGTAEANSTVTIYDNGIAIGTVTAAANGSWTFTPSVNLSEGSHVLTVRATDVAGNTSAASSGFTITVDITAPAAPSAFVVNDEVGSIRGAVSAGQTTDASQPRLTGRGDPGSTIIIYDNGVEVGRVTVGPNGLWAVAPNGPLSEGPHSVTVREIDAAGNPSGLSQAINFIVDTVAPTQPVIALNPAGNQVTGTAEPNSTITITNGTGQSWTGTTDGSGNFTIPLSPAQTNGQTISVIASDAAGNDSIPATVVATDTIAPNPPADLTVAGNGASVSGTAEANSTVTVKDPGGNVIGTGTTDGTGHFTVPVAPPQTNGEVLEVIAKDPAGNVSQPGHADAPDTTDPLAPDNLAVSDDGTTVTGTAEPGSTVSIKDPDGTELGHATAGDNGDFTVTINPPQLNGETLTADATDHAGNTGPTASVDAPDITPAQTPVITSVYDDVANGIGDVANNGLTNDATPTIRGTGEPGTTLYLFSGSNQIGTLTIPPSGIWEYTPSVHLREGGHVLTATAIDAAGNASGTSNSWSITVDSAAPAAPVITSVVDDVPGRTGPLDTGEITNDARPTLNGTGEPGATISVRLDGVQIGTAVVSDGGSWTFTPTQALPEGGPHTLTAVAIDQAGNVGSPSNGFEIIVDTTPPPAPSIATVTDNTGSVTGPVTSGTPTDETRPVLTGNAPPNTIITVYDGTTLLGTATLNGSGGWSFTPLTPLTNGTHSLTVVATDSAGNSTSSPPFSLVVDTVAPATPDSPDVTVNPDGQPTALNPGEATRDTTPTLSGTGTPGDTVTIYIDGVKQPDVIAVQPNGTWTWTPTQALPNGSYDVALTVTNKDGAGNESAPSQPVTIIIDTDPPATPTAPVVTDNVSQITGPVADNTSTNDSRPVLSGTGTANDVIIIYDSVGGAAKTEVGRVTVGADGNWSWRPDTALTQTTHAFTTTATDEAGNVSGTSPVITVTVDTTPPVTPEITAGTVANGGSTSDATPTISGTGTSGDTVIIYNNGVEVARVPVTGGNWTWTSPSVSDGALKLTVSSVDAAGNVSGTSPVYTITVDTVAPTTPQIDSISSSTLANGTLYTNDNTPTISGKTEIGSTITVRIDGGAPQQATVDANGNWTLTLPNGSALTDAPHTIIVTATDAAGNATPSAPVTVTVDTNAPNAPVVTSLAVEGTPLTGTAEPGSTVIVKGPNNVELGRGVTDGSGNFSIALSPAQNNETTLTVTATDAAGNASGPTSYQVTDTQDLPDVPAITSIVDDNGLSGDVEVKGASSNDTTPILSGTAVANSIVTIYLDGSLVPWAVVTAGPTGAWTASSLVPLGEGPHSFAATATVGAETSGLSPAATVTIDLTAPNAPILGAVTDDVGPGTGPLTNGQITNDSRPTLSGTATAGDTITIYNNGTAIGTVVVGSTGTWSFTPGGALGEGNHALTISATDPAGNESPQSPPFNIVVDTVSTTPVIVGADDNVGTVTGNVPSGGTTNDSTPTLSGTAEANSSIAIFEGSTQIGTATANGSGSWSFTPTTPLGEGSHTFTVIATDPQGNVSTSSNSYTVIVDLTPPAVPVLTSVADDVQGGAVGNLTSGQLTNDSTPTLTGTGVTGSTIHILNNGVEIGTAVVVGGAWTFTPPTGLADGVYNIRINATDPAGNVSANSPVFSFTVDTTPPAAPALTSVQDDVGPITGNITDGGSTNDNRPTFNGTGEIGATVTLLSDGQPFGTAVVNSQGNWTFTPTAPLADGAHTITISTTDVAGNTSTTNTTFTLTVDTQPPAAPLIINATDDVGAILDPVLNGKTTDDTRPQLNGSAEANATIIIYENGVQVGTVQANGSGAWSFTPPSALSNGSHTWTATATDAAGNVSVASPGFTVIVDTIAPLAPAITQAIDDVGTVTGPLGSGQTTDDTLPRLIGTSEPNATINIYEGSTLLGTTTADASGNWAVTITTALTAGPHNLVAQATDAAGNNSDPSPSFSLTIDLTPPTIPVLLTVVDDVGTVTNLTSGQLTNDAQPTLSGTAEAGSTVKIYDNGVLIGSVTATGGAWSFTPTPALSDGLHPLTITATDAAGNASGPTTAFVVNVDATAPIAPVISSVVDDVGTITGPVINGNPTNDTTPTLNGTAEANTTVRIYDNGVLIGTVTADGNGVWTLPQATISLTNGQHNFTATATDAAGNTSAPSSITSIVLDTVAPGVPGTLAVISNGTHVTGLAEAGSTVTITSSTGTVLGTATADGSGAFNVTISPAQTNGETLLAFATDKAGNAGATSNVIAPFTNLPNAPLITTVNDNVGTITGNLTNGKSTDDTTPTLSGTAQPNSIITLYNNGVAMGTATTDVNGNWTFTTPVLGEGSHAFTATATNVIGGTGPVSLPTTVIVDTIAPNAPNGTFNADGSVLTGTAEAGSTVTIRLADGSTVTTTANAGGTYSYSFLNKQTEGQTLQITATDAAGNTSTPGSALAPVVPLSASSNVEELALGTTATVTNAQYSDYGSLLVGALGNVLTLLGNDTAQVGFTVSAGGSADISINANATGVVLSLLNTLEVVVQRWDAVNGTWTTVVDTGLPQFANLLTLGASGVTLNMTGLADGQYRVLSYNTNLLATGSYTSLDVDVTQTSAGTVTGVTTQSGNVIYDVDPTTGSDNAPAGTRITAVTDAQGHTVSVTADGTVIQGQYGTLTINLDGSYTYTLTNTSAAVLGRTESFTYTIGHNGASASAQLVISLGANTVTNSVTAVDDTASFTFDTSVHAINNGTSSQGGFTVVGVNLGNTLGLNLLDDLSNPIIYNVAEGTTRTMTIQASVGGVALASVFDLYVYKFNEATQTFEQMRVQPGWLRAPLLGGTSATLTLNLPAGEYLFLLNTAAGITALTAYTLNVLEDHVYTVSSVGGSTTGDVLADDIAPAGTHVTSVNGVTVNGTGVTTIQGEYGTLTINADGKYTYTLNSGVGADHIKTPDTFVYTVTAPNGDKDTASLNITPTARAMDAVNDVSAVMDVTSVHHTSAYSDTTVGSASWQAALLASTQGSGSGTFVVDPNTALHNVVLHFNVASLLSLGGLTVDWVLSNGSTTIRSGSFNGGLLLGGTATVNLSGLDLDAGTYTLSYTGKMGALAAGQITITPDVVGTTYSLTQFDSTSGHTVNGNIFDGTDSQGAMDQLHSVDTRLSITGYNGVTTTLDPYTTSAANVTIQGHYGTLSIGADGHYTYTMNTGVSLSSITSKEVFNYTLTDAAGKTDSASLTINMAPQFISSEHNDVINGTAYGDTLIYQVLNNTVGNATAGNSTGDHWTNFSISQGDKIDIGDLLVGWNGQASTLGNYVHVTTSGNNTVISIDRDGTGTTYTNTTLVTLDNVQSSYDELVNQHHNIIT